MNKIPEMIFVIDTNVESLAIKEAIKLKIPIVAVLDSTLIQQELTIQFQATMMLEDLLIFTVSY